MSAQAGYAAARNILASRFGSSYRVCQAWLEKLLGYPAIKSPEDMDAFACDLVCCYEGLRSIDCLAELECTNTLRLVVAKLPYHLRNRWRKVNRESRLHRGKSQVQLLIELVRDAAEDVNDPAYSEGAIERARNTYEIAGASRHKKSGYRKAGVHMTEGELESSLIDFEAEPETACVFHNESEKPACVVCGSQNHFTSKCRKFNDKAPTDRLRFVMEKGLCQLCLGTGHMAKDCALPWRCQEKGCTCRHHMALHSAFGQDMEGKEEKITSEDKPRKESVHALQITADMVGPECENTCFLTTTLPCLPVTAVTVKYGETKVEAYALLDTGSTMTLNTARLAQSLNVKPTGYSRVSVNTITDKKEVNGALVTFDVWSASEEEYQPVWESLTVPELPISLEHIVTANKMLEWKHLKDVDMPRVNSKAVDILVGQDNAHLLEPLSFSEVEKPLTRRGLVSSVSSLFDPMGFLVPFTVSAKVLMQRGCRADTGWDRPLPEELIKQWARWLVDLADVPQVEIPRWVRAAPDSKNTLHHFGDASQEAYGSGSFLLVQTVAGEFVDCNLMLGKSKVAPPRTQSIPRLELCASVLIVKVDESMCKELTIPLETSRFWSDSAIVLFYILGDPACYKPFMANRVAYIQEHTRKSQWSHVPGTQNPADLVSRGVKAGQLKDNQLWYKGPEFLKQPRDQWPNLSVAKKSEVGSDVVKKVKPIYTLIGELIHNTGRREAEKQDSTKFRPDLPPQLMTPLIPCPVIKSSSSSCGWEEDCAEERSRLLETSSEQQVLSIVHKLKPQSGDGEAETLIKQWVEQGTSWYTLRRRAAWIARFGVFCENKLLKRSKPLERGPLRWEELQAAEHKLIHIAQKWHLQDSAMRQEPWKKWNQVKVDGVWRVSSRVDFGDLLTEYKNQYVIPRKSHAAKLILEEVHEEAMHPGVDRTLMELREKFWIPHARKMAIKLRNRCIVCKRVRGKPMRQRMSKLPKRRVSYNTAPFQHTGVDLFGPLLVTVRRSREKRYGVLYTCLNTRAVHLEIAHDLTTSSFLNTLERFAARRGKPESITSDNRTNLVGAKKELKLAELMVKDQKIAEFMVRKRLSGLPAAQLINLLQLTESFALILGRHKNKYLAYMNILIRVSGLLLPPSLCSMITVQPISREELIRNYVYPAKQINPGSYVKQVV